MLQHILKSILDHTMSLTWVAHFPIYIIAFYLRYVLSYIHTPSMTDNNHNAKLNTQWKYVAIDSHNTFWRMPNAHVLDIKPKG